MKLFSQTERAFYLFKDDRYEDGVVCHTFDFTPGSLVSDLFTTKEAVKYLAKADSSIKFIQLDYETYCFVRTRGKTYASQYCNNLASIVGSLVAPSNFPRFDALSWLTLFVEFEGEIFFVKDNGVMMIDLWLKGKRGCFRYTNVNQFIKNVEKFCEKN